MIFYILYKMGHFLAMTLPLKASYTLACTVADAFYYISRKDREAVKGNIKIITGSAIDEKKLSIMAKGVFRNFAKYLVDFFRASKVDEEYMKKFVKVDGLNYVDEALSHGKGVIVLSAHIGNWELGGLVLSMLRPPLQAVVLTHQNKRVNDFFTAQRRVGNLTPVEIGISLRSCYNMLKKNGLLAMLGDRDFSKNGLYTNFFNRPTLIPKGPAVFSHRLGSAIVPCFMIREEDDTFRFTFEPPIYPETTQDEDSSIKRLTQKYSSVIEGYVHRYPTQWYVFKNVWNGNDKKVLRPDTII